MQNLIMKDLKHYFNSPPSDDKKSDSNVTLDEEANQIKTFKSDKKLKKRKPKKKSKSVQKLLKNKCESELLIDDKEGSDIDLEHEITSLNGELNSSVLSNLSENVDESENNSGVSGSQKKKRKRKCSFSESEPSKKARRKILKGRLKIVSSYENHDNENLSDCSVNISEVVHPETSNSSKKNKFIDEFNENMGNVKISTRQKKRKKCCCSEDKIKTTSTHNNSDSECVTKENSKDKKRRKKKKHKNKSESINELNDNELLDTTDLNIFNNLKESDDTSLQLSINSNEQTIEKQEPEKRNSLFNYYTKIDKATFQSTKVNEKIQVKAIVHTPPNTKSKRSIDKLTDSTSQKFKKKNHCKKDILNTADEITVISSEIISETCEEDCAIVEDVTDTISHDKSTLSLTPVSGNFWKMRVMLSSSKSEKIDESIDDSSLSKSDDSIVEGENTQVIKSVSLDDPVKNDVSSSKSLKKSSFLNGPHNENAVQVIGSNVSLNNIHVTKDDKGVKLKRNKFAEEVEKKIVLGNKFIELFNRMQSMEKKSSVIHSDDNDSEFCDDSHNSKGAKENKLKAKKCNGNEKKVFLGNKYKKLSNGTSSTKKKPTGSSKLGDDSSSDDVIEVKCAPAKGSSSNNSKTTQNKKSPSGATLMAKFLGRSTKDIVKPIIDPAVLKARQKFLESGIPDVIRQKSENSQSEKILGSLAPFPKISHVQQRNPLHIIWNLPATTIKLLPAPCYDIASLSITWSSLSSKVEPATSSDKSNNSKQVLVRVGDQKEIIKQLKKIEKTFEVGEHWKTIKDMREAAANSDIWPDVYKPRKSSDFIGNGDCIEKLKYWMESLKNRRCERLDGDSSGEDFVDSGSDEQSNSQGSSCIIYGPNGCGKTSAVFAIANELGYKVFEVNASCNRNGKRVLTDLSEATQSHQVEHPQVLKNFFQKGKVKEKKKKKKKHKDEVKQESKKRSLILIEDADLLFNDKDEGFVAAITNLVSSSKRPLVLVVNDINAPHLTKLIGLNQLKLCFSLPSAAKLGLWLQLIALADGLQLDSIEAQKLVHWSNCDIRKSFLQLQLLVQSYAASEKSCWPGISDSPVWVSGIACKDITYKKDEILEANDKIAHKSALKRELNNAVRLTHSLVTHDLLVQSSLFQFDKFRDPCPVRCKVFPEDSTSLLENTNSLNVNNLSSDIADYLYGSVITCATSELRNPSHGRKMDDVLMAAFPLNIHCSHDAVYTDYFPTLRSFGRVEKVRLALHTKRTNRFFNYLNGLGVHASDSSLKYMCDTFT